MKFSPEESLAFSAILLLLLLAMGAVLWIVGRGIRKLLHPYAPTSAPTASGNSEVKKWVLLGLVLLVLLGLYNQW